LYSRALERFLPAAFLCLIDSVGRKTTEHPVLAYHSFIAVLLLSLVLRILAGPARSGGFLVNDSEKSGAAFD
jgi:hypothetical protein